MSQPHTTENLTEKPRKIHPILQHAREEETKKNGYNSQQARGAIVEEVWKRMEKEPYTWQLDITEALLLGCDCIVIASTGAGKSLPFVMPLFVRPEKYVLVLSPLKTLQCEQAKRFNGLGVAAAAVNGETWSPRLAKALREESYHVILTSPEMGLQNEELREAIRKLGAAKKVLAVVVDEAHCISAWGGDFRPAYSRLVKFRSLVLNDVPFLVTSATLSRHALKDVCANLDNDLNDAVLVNLGNYRPNVEVSVKFMNSSNDYAALTHLLPSPDNITSATGIPKTIIFSDSITTCMLVWHYLQEYYERFGQAGEEVIGFLHSYRKKYSKRRVLQNFRQGLTRILSATEVAGMGLDEPDIDQVFQFGLPKSLTVWIQRAGRAGRKLHHATAIILAEKSALERIKPGKRYTSQKNEQKKRRVEPETEDDVDQIEQDDEEGHDEGNEGVVEGGVLEEEVVDEVVDREQPAEEEVEEVLDMFDDGKVWRKKVDGDVRRYIETTECRHHITDEYFSNPPRPLLQAAARSTSVRSTTTPPDCDNCHRVLDLSQNTGANLTSTTTIHSQTTNHKRKRGMKDGQELETKEKKVGVLGIQRRNGLHLDRVRRALFAWRTETYEHLYTPSIFFQEDILPKKVINSLAANGCIQTISDIEEMLPTPWTLAPKHGEEVLGLIKHLDEQELERRQLEKPRAQPRARRGQNRNSPPSDPFVNATPSTFVEPS